MPVDIQEYLEYRNPLNVLNLIDEPVLQNFIAGYSHLAFSGAVILYKNCDDFPHADSNIIGTTSGPRAHEWYHPFCRFCRVDCIQNELCERFDRMIVRKYYEDEGKGPMLYRCHRHLWDMTYPVRVAGHLVGVLFGGQMILRERNVRWDESLSQIREYVDWKSFDKTHVDQQADMVASIMSAQWGLTDVQQEHAKRIIEENNEPNETAKNTSLPEMVERFHEFLHFGEVTTGLLQQLYGVRAYAAGQKLLRRMATELASTTFDTGEWWNVLARVMQDFQRATGVQGFDVYVRKNSTYVQTIAGSQAMATSVTRGSPASACIELPAERLIDFVDPCVPRPLRSLGTKGASYLYKVDLAGPDDRSISTVILAHGKPQDDPLRDFIQEFCGMIGLRVDVSSVQYQIERDRQEYRDRVRRISHTVKTPLQIALNEIRRSKAKLPRITQESPGTAKMEIMQHLEVGRENILRAKGEMSELHAKSTLPRKPEDVRQIVKELVSELEPLASEKGCEFQLTFSHEPLICRIQKDELRIALRNLLDNAVKFSFHNQVIRISGRNTAGQTALIRISNYGVGIPKEKMEIITELGERGGVVDRERPREKRPGTGLGLSIAMRIIHDHGGAINIDSYPPNKSWQETHMRYVTRVEVNLPLHIDR